MTWNELNALADELHQAYDRGAFQGLPLVLFGNPQVMRPELLAQITPADIDHVRHWERTHIPHRSWYEPRKNLSESVRRLLALVNSP